MKKLAIALTATLLSLGLAAGAWSQTRPSSDTGAKHTDDAQRRVWSPDATSLETSKIIGTRVKTPDGTSVGSIDQLIINPTDGKITHAVIGTGGVLGMGETKLVFKWADVKFQHDPDYPDRWHAVIDQGKRDAAPRFEARKDGDTAPAASPRATPPVKRTTEPAKKY